MIPYILPFVNVQLRRRGCSVSADDTVQPNATRVFNFKRPRCSSGALYSAYPVFEETIYSDLNNVILREVESWNTLYSEICSQAELDCQIDMSLTSFGRYVRSQYEVSDIGEKLTICFTVDWIADLGNHEPSYTKTFTLDRSTNMIYETYTTSKRVY